ncbi:hypothetical protein RND81_12G198400 [Saponaria officinalis]|uniref:AT hook motif-containing protein n=1 Tax=Saponaria officinalis TaxID=3572 RepID=A0AAW1HD33_SAPOF
MEMNQQNEVSNSLPTPDVTMKKKRGRPRKDPTKLAYVPRKRLLTQNYSESAPVPPGFEESNGSQPRPVDAVDDTNVDSMVGKVVNGVIEAVFDAGYLLSVRVGDSDTFLRGVVFKSGHYVPVSPENDLAPGLPMIKRNDVPFPVGNETRKHKHKGRKRNDYLAVYQPNGSPASNQMASIRARELAIVPAQPPRPDPLESRGTLVPVLLQPVKLSNGAMPAVEVHPIASQPAHLAASKRKLVVPPSHIVPEASPNGSASRHFEELINIAKKLKGLKGGPHSAEFQNDTEKSFSKTLPNYSGLTQDEAQDFSKPLYVEPLQAIHSGLGNRSAPMSHPFPERSTGKMTELLLAVQENLKERQHQEMRNPGN